MSTFAISVQQCTTGSSLGNQARKNKTEKQIKVTQTGKEEVKLSPNADDIILHIENSLAKRLRLALLPHSPYCIGKPAIPLRYACTKNCKTLLLKEIKDTIKCKDILCSWIRRLNIKMTILKLSYRFNAIPIRIPANSFMKTDKLILKFIWNCKGLKSSQNNLERQEQIRMIHTS